mmetsp:Transcript_26122/g.74896  ORF Transcript_26122/g.74896 Transcript_26122/m.74896 type:complete len:502 (-) Transcript_26122:99-1604(-)
MDSQTGTQWATFHQTAGICGIWILVIFVGVHAMSAMQSVLMPLLWAFFLMMGLVPATDAVESLLLYSCAGTARVLAACWRTVAPCSQQVFRCCNRRLPRLPSLEAAEAGAQQPEDQPDDDDSSEAEHLSVGLWRRQLARILAVIFVVACFVGLIVLFFMLVIQSVEQMKSNWAWYKQGARRIADDVNRALVRLSKLVPPALVDKVTGNALEALENAVSALMKPVLEHLTSMLVEVIMMLLYMTFWLCNPIEINTTVARLFKRYILLKGAVSALYATCIWILLHMLHVDLAIIFGCFTFLLNFVPEVGPFVAAVLPAPVILLDGRLRNPWATLAVALGSELGLKFLFGNIVEVKLIESDRNMKMHPVVILFCVAFFGWVWGPTGMLLSVPIMATLKAVAQKEAVPPAYRHGVLRLLEGSRRPRHAKGPAEAASSPEAAPVVEQLAELVSYVRSPGSLRPGEDAEPPAPLRAEGAAVGPGGGGHALAAPRAVAPARGRCPCLV